MLTPTLLFCLFMAGPTKNAKVASKNNPSTRGAKIKMFFRNEEVVPVKFIGSPIGLGTYMAMSALNGENHEL